MSIVSLVERFSKPKSDPVGGSGNEGLVSIPNQGYKPIPENWYTAKPYGFKLTLRNGAQSVFFLPLSPSNLQITTNFATNIIPTLYGTVEEHSEIRYYDISIQGTTGIAPKFVAEYGKGKAAAASQDTGVKGTGRLTYPITGSIELGGFFSKTLGVVNQILNKASDLMDDKRQLKTGVYVDKSGYMAFHNFYKFFLKYKRDASGVNSVDSRKTHPLTFFNYKDNNEYDVAIRSFVLTRSADNPMLYNYQITMRAYNLRGVGEKLDSGDLKTRLADLGLNGVDSSSLLGDIKKTSNSAKSIIGSLVGGVNILGR